MAALRHAFADSPQDADFSGVGPAVFMQLLTPMADPTAARQNRLLTDYACRRASASVL
jgi:hypothetical protein